MDTVSRAGRFLEEQGRDIERARFGYHFGNASKDELLEALCRYQNPDGGFGHGLEPDIKAPDSNPFATELALLICLQAEVPKEHPLLQRTAEHLEATQGDDGSWRFSAGVYEHPIAPWFAGWQWPALNPSCTLAGLLRELGLGSERLHGRVAALFAGLARLEDLLGDDYYAARPYAYYFVTEWDHPERELYASGVLWWLIRQHAERRGLALDYVRNPRTYFGRLLPRKMLDGALDALAAEQEADGGWPTEYDEHWRGFATVQNLLVLRAFGKI